MKSLIVGAGFGSLYKQILQDMSTVVTVDSDPSKNADFLTVEEAIAQHVRFDTANICLPNFLHRPVAEKIAGYADVIFVEKPGFKTAEEWDLFNPNGSRICMVKNNMWRDEIGYFRDMAAKSDYIKINWINKNRIPNPGSWFTNKDLAFGGVSRDLIPHLLSIFAAIDPNYAKSKVVVARCFERYELSDLVNSDYGTVVEDGVYDVDDYCSLGIMSLEQKSWNLTADWRSGNEDRINIEFYNKDIFLGSHPLGLCPEYAYLKMITDALENLDNDTYWAEQKRKDLYIHRILDDLSCR